MLKFVEALKKLPMDTRAVPILESKSVLGHAVIIQPFYTWNLEQWLLTFKPKI